MSSGVRLSANELNATSCPSADKAASPLGPSDFGVVRAIVSVLRSKTKMSAWPLVSSASLDYALESANPDVALTMQWLLSEGADVAREMGGPTDPQGFGDILIEFVLADTTVLITRDRGQWMMTVQAPGLSRFDFGLIHQTRNHEDPWEPPWLGRSWPAGKQTIRLATASAPTLPPQLPPGVSWREELPKALDWLSTTADAEAQLQAMKQVRLAYRLGAVRRPPFWRRWFR